MEKLLKEVLQNQVILFKVLTELDERSKGFSTYKPYQFYYEQLAQERERLEKVITEQVSAGHLAS